MQQLFTRLFNQHAMCRQCCSHHSGVTDSEDSHPGSNGCMRVQQGPQCCVLSGWHTAARATQQHRPLLHKQAVCDRPNTLINKHRQLSAEVQVLQVQLKLENLTSNSGVIIILVRKQTQAHTLHTIERS